MPRCMDLATPFLLIKQTMRQMRYTMKYNIYFLLFLALGLLGACRKGEEKPKSEPRGSDEYLMKRVGLSTFSSIHRETDGSTRKMRESEMSTLFGELIDLTAPSMILFAKDSLTIEKPEGVVEKFKIRWQGKELWLYHDFARRWARAGLMGDDATFKLRLSYFNLMDGHPHRLILHRGVEYGSLSGSDWELSEGAMLDYLEQDAKFVFVPSKK